MKNVFRFIQWQFNKLNAFGKLSFTSMFCIFLSVVTMRYDTVSDALLMIGAAGVASMFVMLFYDIIKTQYAEFKKERQSLFDTIKNSDK